MSVHPVDFFDIKNRIEELSERNVSFNDAEAQKLVSDLRRFYAPIMPIVSFSVGDTTNPITADSPLNLRFITEFMAESFRREAGVIFGKTMPQQFSAFRRGIYQAWLIYLDSRRDDITEQNKQEVCSREGIVAVKIVVGCCLFYKDDKLTPEQKKRSEWVGAFAWVHPFFRNTGALKSVWTSFDKYGDYWLEGPLSSEMESIRIKKEISAERVLAPDRYRASVNDIVDGES